MDKRANLPLRQDGTALLAELGDRSKVCVFRALQLGDMLCAVPALRALRAAAPAAHITLVGLPWAAAFASRFARYIDAFASFPGFPGLPEQLPDLASLPAFLGTMQATRFDLALQLHGSGLLSNPLVASLGAARNAGFYVEGNFCPDPGHFMPWNDSQHEILRCLQLLEWLGAPAQGDWLEFPLTEADHDALRRSCRDLPAPRSYACIHPGARMPSRRWHAGRFAEVADHLQAQGLRVVLTGSAQEQELANAVERAMRTKALNLCGKTELGTYAALVAGARLMVCNDTGASHVAVAVGTPSVVICCGADPRRWAPLGRRRHRTVFADVPCRPCMHQLCPTGHACAEQLEVTAVLREAEELLADLAALRSPAHAPVRA